jgi:hypothetical protein
VRAMGVAEILLMDQDLEAEKHAPI